MPYVVLRIVVVRSCLQLTHVSMQHVATEKQAIDAVAEVRMSF
jgi:hypothetical protein